MTQIRRFSACDLFKFNKINLDPLTETYSISSYLHYLSNWPNYFYAIQHPNDNIIGYVMGKAEGLGELWHGHVSALTVAPQYRRLGLAWELMALLERVSQEGYNAYFVDLFVRVSNSTAVSMYEKMGYTVYRRVIQYYADPNGEDAFDMRKALKRDVEKKSVIPLGRDVYPEELEWN